MKSAYLELHERGELAQRARAALEMLRNCNLCPHRCGVDRIAGEQGVCRSGRTAFVSSHNSHRGEEPPISGTRGSGTIFLTNCNLRCEFCQNFPISQLGNGEEAPPLRLADMMLSLQRRGCHNINFVTPTHFMPQILEALVIAADAGLNVSLVYNCNAYESLESLKLLDGVIDIYMPDFKYASDEYSLKYSRAPEYFKHAGAAIKEMYRQTGPLALDEEGIAVRGLIIRHLVLPDGVAGSREVFGFIAREIGTDVFMSIMEQYFPAHRAAEHPQIARRITDDEYDDALGAAEDLGLTGWAQDRDDRGGC